MSAFTARQGRDGRFTGRGAIAGASLFSLSRATRSASAAQTWLGSSDGFAIDFRDNSFATMESSSFAIDLTTNSYQTRT